MIDANELRIGNWVWINYYDGKHSEQISFIDDSMPLEDYYPIPLTSGILEKCGFINAGISVESNWHYMLISIPTNHMNVTYELNLFTTDEEGKYGVNLEEQYFGYCRYLHQLQNLYYALTQKELQLNEAYENRNK